MAQSIVTCSPDILSGTPVFTGTRVPVQALIDYLEGGETIDRVTRFIEPPIRSARPDPAVTRALAQRKAWRGHMDRHLNTRSSRQPPGALDDDGEPLTQAQVRELRRRAADLDDPARYLLVSQFRPRFALYYNVSDDVYAMNDPRSATRHPGPSLHYQAR